MKKSSRRSFLKSASAATAGAIIIPNMIGCSPNKRLNFAVIGVGGRGSASWSKIPLDDIVAVCDVDSKKAAAGFKKLRKAKKYKDFRVMFDEMAKDIDAVIIATPDHTHFPATMAAMELGKHVFVEKPLAHNIWQVRTMKKAAKYYGVISQMGNQGHTTNGIRQIKEWYDAGVLGQVKEVYGWMKGFNPASSTYPPPKQPVPSHLDWDLWLGPAANRDYSSAYCPGLWRLHYDFGNGQLGDWACHSLDAPFWALDLGMPHTVEASVENPIPDHSYISEKAVVKYQFGARGDKAPVKLTWSESTTPDKDPNEVGLKVWPREGVVIIGEKNTLMTGMRPNNPRLILPEEEWKEFKKNAPEQIIPRIGDETPVKEWLDAIKGDYLPGSNFDYSASLTEMALLGVMATRFNTGFEYDAENMKVINRPDLDTYIKEPARAGWSSGENI
ncbi:MAG: Gfo/Idh/MocA family oxidoreductase [Bacteroidetes bacterium]|nr:Gfo/Idh/MocA family oxidoreductase [Bacteroidota bacterium]